MDLSDKFRVDRLCMYVNLIGPRITRSAAPAKEIFILEPAGPWHHAPADWDVQPVELRVRHHVRWLEACPCA